MFQIKLDLTPSPGVPYTKSLSVVAGVSPCLQGKTEGEGVTCSVGTYGEPPGLPSAEGTTEQPLVILPAPRRWVSQQRPGQASPHSTSQSFPRGSCHLPGHFEAAEYCHTTQNCSQINPRNCLFPIRGVLPVLRPSLCPSPPSTSLSPSSLAAFTGNTMSPRLPGEGTRGTEASLFVPNSHPVTHRLVLTSPRCRFISPAGPFSELWVF